MTTGITYESHKKTESKNGSVMLFLWQGQQDLNTYSVFPLFKAVFSQKGRQENINTTSIIKLSKKVYQLILSHYTLLG